MTRRIFLVCLAGLLAWSSRPSSSRANDLEPQVRLMQAGAARLIEDMQAVMSLTNEKEQTQKIKDYLDLSFIGMSFDRLMRLDVLFGDGPVRYRPAFPLEDEQTFWGKNLIPNGIQKKRRLQATLTSTQGAFEGFLRIRDNYAIFAEKREDLPLNAPPPDKEVVHLRKLTDNAAVELVNAPEGVTYRRNSYHSEQGLRKELSDQIIKAKSETQDAFDLRKLAVEHQLDDLERFYVEAAYSLVVAHFDRAKKTTSLSFDLQPIPDTTLAQSIQQLNQSPMSFANVPKSAKSNMSLRAKLPLDEMRQRHLTETLELLRKISHKEADKNQKKSVAQKDVTEEVIDLSFNLLLANVKGGMADGFFEAHSNPDGTNTAIAGFKAVDGNAPLEILNLLEKTRDDQDVEMDLAEVNGVKLHSFLISAEQHPSFRNFFGGYKVFVGTSADTIWLGTGPKALEEIQAAIREVAKPNIGKASDPFLTISGRAAPWLELHQKSYPESGSKAFQDYRRMMIEAGRPGDDQFDAWLNRQGDDVKGRWSAQPGWARFLGKYLADFSKKNL